MRKKLKLRIHHLVLLILVLVPAIYLALQPTAISQFSFFRKKNIQQLAVDAIDFTTLEEAGNITKSSSKNWWVNSGGLVTNQNGTVKSIQGDLNQNSRWYKAYSRSNPTDTDNGKHPQNILRLVNKNSLQNIHQQAYFKINKTVMSISPNRNESNGLLFFHRYLDGNNLYYTGIRVDGTSIIKKKKNGTYYTMAQNPLFKGTYQKDTTPNLLPQNKWIGLRSEVKNLNFREVEIKVFIDKLGNGNWELIAEAIDDGQKYDGAAFINPGFAGIRTDFMDIEFKDYSITQI